MTRPEGAVPAGAVAGRQATATSMITEFLNAPMPEANCSLIA
jgi:hypothetical protein